MYAAKADSAAFRHGRTAGYSNTMALLHDAAVPFRTIDPAEQTVLESYKLMTGLIVPRPVALVSTVDRDGIANVAPFSFFSGVGANPPTVLFCPSLRSAGAGRPDDRKDTLRNVEQTGEFVVNIVSDAIAAAANTTAADVGPEIDEFLLAGLTAIPSEVVRAPRVAESPAQLECKLQQIVFAGQGSGAGVVVIGEIVRFHLRLDLESNFRIDPARLDAVGRMAGNTWVRTRECFELERPK
jgi:flavin reductase (DIM6/NTAB) family NADH-FMN oxidoreductase RutF